MQANEISASTRTDKQIECIARQKSRQTALSLRRTVTHTRLYPLQPRKLILQEHRVFDDTNMVAIANTKCKKQVLRRINIGKQIARKYQEEKLGTNRA